MVETPFHGRNHTSTGGFLPSRAGQLGRQEDKDAAGTDATTQESFGAVPDRVCLDFGGCFLEPMVTPKKTKQT